MTAAEQWQVEVASEAMIVGLSWRHVTSSPATAMLRAAVLSVGLAGTTPASSLLLLRGSSFAAPRLLAAPPRVVAARGVSSAKGGRGGKGMAEFRNPHNLPVKTCVVCDRPFTWRKKWERCWDEVTTCSKSCNAQRRRAKGSNGKAPPETNGADPAAVSH